MFGAIYLSMWLACLLGIPPLIVFSFRGWAATDRTALPALRSRIGVVSVGAIFRGWLFLIVLTILGVFNDRWIDFFTERKNINFLILAVTASVTPDAERCACTSGGRRSVIGSVVNAMALKGYALAKYVGLGAAEEVAGEEGYVGGAFG
jgi:hypothetical protein